MCHSTMYHVRYGYMPCGTRVFTICHASMSYDKRVCTICPQTTRICARRRASMYHVPYEYVPCAMRVMYRMSCGYAPCAKRVCTRAPLEYTMCHGTYHVSCEHVPNAMRVHMCHVPSRPAEITNCRPLRPPCC